MSDNIVIGGKDYRPLIKGDAAVEPPSPPPYVTMLVVTGVDTLNQGESSQFIATAHFSNSTVATVTFSCSWSSNNAYASVNSTGLVTGVTGAIPIGNLSRITAGYVDPAYGNTVYGHAYVEIMLIQVPVFLISAGSDQTSSCTPIIYLEAIVEGDPNLYNHTHEWEQLDINIVGLTEVSPTKSYYTNDYTSHQFRYWIDRGEPNEQYRDVRVDTTPTDVTKSFGNLHAWSTAGTNRLPYTSQTGVDVTNLDYFRYGVPTVYVNCVPSLPHNDSIASQTATYLTWGFIQYTPTLITAFLIERYNSATGQWINETTLASTVYQYQPIFPNTLYRVGTVYTDIPIRIWTTTPGAQTYVQYSSPINSSHVYYKNQVDTVSFATPQIGHLDAAVSNVTVSLYTVITLNTNTPGLDEYQTANNFANTLDVNVNNVNVFLYTLTGIPELPTDYATEAGLNVLQTQTSNVSVLAIGGIIIGG